MELVIINKIDINFISNTKFIKELICMDKCELKFGTKEWAPNNFNFMNGCSNDCVYCYAKEMAIRFKRKDYESWKIEEPACLNGKSYRKRSGAIMIPSSHDITPANIDIAEQVISKLLDSENELLIVTKPHFECMRRIIKLARNKHDNIKFRFTIGSSSSEVLKLWEPGAPDFDERLSALILAYNEGFSTSISCEPLLDNNFDALYDKLVPYVTDCIWIGKMNMAVKRVRTNTANSFSCEKLNKLLTWQSDENIIQLYLKYMNNSKVEWKDSIKKVIMKYNLL